MERGIAGFAPNELRPRTTGDGTARNPTAAVPDVKAGNVVNNEPKNGLLYSKIVPVGV